jgi:hypothetical protein
VPAQKARARPERPTDDPTGAKAETPRRGGEAPGALAQGLARESAAIAGPAADVLPVAEGRVEPPAFGRDAPPAPAPGRAAVPTAAQPGELAPFVPQLQATALALGGQAERVTARLIARRDEDGSRLTIELDPAELGSVEVSLRLDDRGTATATFTVERPETLQLLQRDTRTLVDLLAGAGFSVDSGGLGFELRQEQQQARQQQQQQQQQSGAGLSAQGHGEGGDGRASAAPAPQPAGRGLLDLRV